MERTILVLDDQIGETGSLQQKGFLLRYEQLPFNFIFESCRGEDGYAVEVAFSTVERETEAQLVLLDLKFGPENELLGFEILRRISARYPSLPGLVMTARDRDVEMIDQCL